MTAPPVDEEPATMWRPDRQSERRSLLLCAIGAIAGLAVAGAGLFTAQGTRIAGVPPEDVAIVNQVPILMSDYVAQVQAVYSVGLAQATPQQKRTILDQMIREELYVQRGIELGLQSDVTEVRTSLVGAVEAQQAIDADATQPDEPSLRAFYAARLGTYADEGRLTLTDYVGANEAQAEAAAKAVHGGQPVAAAMATAGLRTSGKVDDGEEYYFAARIHLGDRLFATARHLADGQLSSPQRMADGVHVLAMQHNLPPRSQPFERVRDRVLSDYRADKVARMQGGADRFLRKRADVQIAAGIE